MTFNHDHFRWQFGLVKQRQMPLRVADPFYVVHAVLGFGINVYWNRNQRFADNL